MALFLPVNGSPNLESSMSEGNKKELKYVKSLPHVSISRITTIPASVSTFNNC